jgi:hypothetical protein
MLFKFAVVAAKNYERKMLPAPFNYVVLVVGKTPGRKETYIITFQSR